MGTHGYRCLQRPEEGIGCPGAGVPVGYELPGVCVRSSTQFYCRSRKHSFLLCHPSTRPDLFC